MYLKKLEIYGFKSFGDRISIKFNPGVTAIVGPNGSGKSNIADAVRWVLGEQSAKTLRGSKMEDIIFSGTQVRKALGFAEVSLTINNECGSLPFEYSEITVTRRMFRSGESEYYINGTQCRLKDILELFMDTGVGKEGYSIIGQGRIDDILSSRSEQRRYIFEEAAGIVKYRSRREEAERKLQKTQDNINRVDDIIGELEQQLEPLKIQSDIAKQFLRFKEQLRYYDINHFLRVYEKQTGKIQSIRDQIKYLEGEIENYKNKQAKYEKTEYEIKVELNKLNKDIDTSSKEKYDYLNDIEKLKGELGILNEKVLQKKEENIRIDKEVEHDLEAIKNKTNEVDNLKDETEIKKVHLLELANIVDELSQQLNDIQKEILSNQDEMEKRKGDIIGLINNISESRSKKIRLQTLETSIENRIEQLKNQTNDKKSKREKLISQQHKVRINKKKIIDEKNIAAKNKDRIIGELSIRKNNLIKMENDIQHKRQLLEGSRSRLSLLQDMEKGHEGYYRSVKEILAASEQNSTISNKVCGVVAGLINVPREFELAIETALGSSLQNIVTNCEEDAKYLIDYLRKNKYGRATFLPVSSMKPRVLNAHEKTVLNMEGCLGIASDLIHFDIRYKGIMENLLGRVVVTENMDEAIHIARKYSYSFRIVTLKGDVLNPGGSMTGGSSGQKTAGLLGRTREIDELKDKVREMEEKLSILLKTKDELIKDYQNKENELEFIDKKLQELNTQKIVIDEQLASINSQTSNMDKEIESLYLEIAELEKDYIEIQEAIIKQEDELNALETKNETVRDIAQNVEETLKDITNKKDRLHTRATETRIEMASVEKELSLLAARQDSITREIKELTQRNKDKRNTLVLNSELIKKYEIEIQNNSQNIINLEHRIQMINKRLKEFQQKKDKTEEMLNEIETAIKDYSRLSNEIIEKKHRFEVQLSRLEAETDNLQNRIWEDYEISYNNAIQFMDESLSLNVINSNIQNIKDSIKKLGEVNVAAIDEYKRIRERFEFLTSQRKDLIFAKDDLKTIIKDITKTMENQFNEEFNIINEHFNEVFCSLFGGGKAQLVLENEDDILGCGIDIIAQPPGKKLQNLSLLSGGEKALTAIAILFAILKRKPTPFCVLDEIEAALDESNVHNFGSFIREFSKSTQFVIITHRKGTMEACDCLYGVAMEEKGISRLVSVKLEEKVS